VARLLAETLFGLERSEASVLAFERAVELDPGNDASLRGLVRALEAAGRTDDAVAQLAAFAERQPCSVVRTQLGRRLHALEHYAEQHRVLADGVAACPDSPGVLNDYAWLLATSPLAALRDGALAVEIAERAIASREGAAGVNELDTLAAAYAEAGDFESAARVARQAVASLEARGAASDSLAAYRERVETFERHQPVRY
jgi:tetratricopeptide (TPR) repeat protein